MASSDARKSACRRCSIALRASSNSARIASSAEPSPGSGRRSARNSSSLSPKSPASNLSRRARNTRTDSRTSCSLTSRRRSRHEPGRARRVTRSRSTAGSTTLATNAPAAAKKRLRSPGAACAMGTPRLANSPASNTNPVTATAPSPPRKIDHMWDRRTYSSKIRSSASGRALTRSRAKSTTARLRAAIAACAASSEPSTEAASPVGGSHSIGGEATSAHTPRKAAIATRRFGSAPN